MGTYGVTRHTCPCIQSVSVSPPSIGIVRENKREAESYLFPCLPIRVSLSLFENLLIFYFISSGIPQRATGSTTSFQQGQD
jgi:hypothetical protein